MSDFPVINGVTTVMPPPDGYEVDFDHPQSYNVVCHYVLFGVMGTLSVVCLAQRLFTKHFIAAGLQADDYLITLAWVFSIVMQAVQIWSISIGGLCHHAWEMPISVFEKHMISSYIGATAFIICNGLSKTSLLTFYLRISPQKWFKTTIWVAISMVIGYATTITGLLLFGCQPISSAWDPYVTNGTCVSQPAVYIAMAVSNIVSDVVLFIIPIPTVLGLKMPTAQKLGAGLMFGVGSVTLATSVVRMVYLPSLLSAVDIPWVAARANVWSFVEANLFIICGSFPTARKFLKRFAPGFMGTWGSRPSRSTYALSESKLARTPRAGYSQFGDTEMDNLSDKTGQDVQVQSTAVGAHGPSTSVDCEASRGRNNRDDASDEAILDNGGISYTRTFQVQYSSK